LVEAEPPEEHELASDFEAEARSAVYSAIQMWEPHRDALVAVDSRIWRERAANYRRIRARIDDSCRRYLDLIDRVDDGPLGALSAKERGEARDDYGQSLSGYHGAERRRLSYARNMGSWFYLTTQRAEAVARVATAQSEAEARRMIADRDEDWPIENLPAKEEDG
jgi:hypothetical protein